MSIAPALRASARSAYRDVWRAASVAFYGDAPILQAFRQKARQDAVNAAKNATDVASYEQYNQLFREMATVLRTNIVQGTKVGESDGKDVYRVNIRKDTELGDNDTVKNPDPAPAGPNGRQRETTDAVQAEDSATDLPKPSHRPLHYSALKRAHTQRVIPELREQDIEEVFVRGSGPGGQSINKTENNVQLLHKPTGLRVACQETRSLSQNRKIARKRLLEKLDQMMNPGLSKEQMKAAKQRERERRRRKKAKKKNALKESSPAESVDKHD